MDPEIKRLYDEANALHLQAKAIADEFKGKDMPAEKMQQWQTLLDQVDAKIEAAKSRERQVEQEAFMNDPATRLDAKMNDGGQETKIVWNGRELDAGEIADLKIGAFPAFIGKLNEPYAKAWRAYMRKGAGLLTTEQVKALSVGTAPEGGYLVQDTFLNQLIVKSREVSAMRRICNVLPPVPMGAVIVPTEDSVFSDAEWTTELATGSEDTIAPAGQKRLTPHPMAKRVKVSNTFFRTPGFDVEGYVRDRLAYKFGGTEENGFVNGLGVNGALGILNTPSLPTHTTDSSNAVYGNDIINFLYKLPAAYAQRARILCNRAFVRKVRQITKANAATAFTNYLWQPGLQPGVPNTILDTPYEISDRFDDGLDTSDDWEDNAIVAVVGDFSYYWIVDALTMSIQRLVELYAVTNQTGYIGRKEADGMCMLAEAFCALKIKA